MKYLLKDIGTRPLNGLTMGLLLALAVLCGAWYLYHILYAQKTAQSETHTPIIETMTEHADTIPAELKDEIMQGQLVAYRIYSSKDVPGIRQYLKAGVGKDPVFKTAESVDQTSDDEILGNIAVPFIEGLEEAGIDSEDAFERWLRSDTTAYTSEGEGRVLIEGAGDLTFEAYVASDGTWH